VSREIPRADLDRDRLLAAPFVGGLWAAVRSVDGPRPDNQDYHHLRGVFDPEWLQTLPLPIGENRPTKQTVSLGKDMHFERHSDEADLQGAYELERRTKIYEAVESRSGGWSAEATRYLMKLAGCDVVCSVYESRAEDKTLGHTETDGTGLSYRYLARRRGNWVKTSEEKSRQSLLKPGTC
jgi:hypothetical protein